MSFLCERVSLGGVFHGLPEIVMRSLTVFFGVIRHSNTVCVCGKIVELRGSLMRAFWHALFS